MSPFNPFAILVLSRPKLTGLGEHWGVRLPDGRVAHCMPVIGVCISSFEDFSAGKDVVVRREVSPALLSEVYRRLNVALFYPRPYDLLSWNCESFANWLTCGEPESAQVAGIGILFFLTLVVAGLSR
ncbi:MAG: hypothetical protein B7X04_01430 [Parcubacteria group bacterium 21-54-25]|nr:MAG: hypothetical protein B7X04_01430 [Parcubacteria group bacterium 21-54-25]